MALFGPFLRLYTGQIYGRSVLRRREWRGEARPGYRYLNFREYLFHALR
jgi:hypothetical protein